MWMRTTRKLAVSLVLMAPTTAFADGAGPIQTPHASEAPAPRSAERGPCVGDGPVAQVASLNGEVRAEGPDGSSRLLDCDDFVRSCERVTTGAGASVALLVDGAVVQLGPETRAELSTRPAPEIALERGGVRVIDSRDEATQRIQLFTPVLSASTRRGDAEMTRDADAVRVCAHDEALVVVSGDGAQTLAAGSCLGTSLQGGLAGSPAGTPGIPLADPGACPFYVAGIPSVLPPVSAAPPGPDIGPFDPPGRDACDTPGSGCAALADDIFEDPDPGTGCGFPGSPCQLD